LNSRCHLFEFALKRGMYSSSREEIYHCSSPALAMAYPRCYVLEFAFLCQLVLLLESAPLSFDYNFSAPGVLDNAYLMYLNDSYPTPPVTGSI
jgi:hypothetical protein